MLPVGATPAPTPTEASSTSQRWRVLQKMLASIFCSARISRPSGRARTIACAVSDDRADRALHSAVRSRRLDVTDRPRLHREHHLRRAIPCRAAFRVTRSGDRRSRRMEPGHFDARGGSKKLRPRRASAQRRALSLQSARVRKGRAGSVGIAGSLMHSCATRNQGCFWIQRSCTS